MSTTVHVDASDYRKMALSKMTEAQFQRQVIDAARQRGWLVHHSRPARRADGSWSTPIIGDPGAPDLLLAKAGVVLLAELKSESGRLTQAQQTWLEATGGEVWRPSDLPRILALLGGNQGALTDSGEDVYVPGAEPDPCPPHQFVRIGRFVTCRRCRAKPDGSEPATPDDLTQVLAEHQEMP